MAWRSGPALLGYSNPRIELAAAIGILPYHMGDLALRLAAGKPTIGEPERQRVMRFLADHARGAQGASPLFGIARGKNVIVINAESLQAFPMDLEINGQPVTPRLSAFARESLHFTSFYDQTHLGTTSDAEFAAMHSLHPLAVGVLSNHFAYNQHRGLPRILSEHGYTTVSACAAQADFWNMRAMHAGLGFQRSFFEDRYRMTERIGPWLADHEFFAQTTAILKAQPAPFMAFLLTASNHHPYRLPPERRELALGDLEGTLLGDYLQSVRYFDRAFGAFVDGLRAAGLLETSVVVLYGDHHGFLGDPPELGRLLGIAARDEYRTLQVRKKVPMMVRLPTARRRACGPSRGAPRHRPDAPLAPRDPARVGPDAGPRSDPGTGPPRGVPGRQLHGRDDLVRPPRRGGGGHVLRGQDGAARRLRRRRRAASRGARPARGVDLVIGAISSRASGLGVDGAPSARAVQSAGYPGS